MGSRRRINPLYEIIDSPENHAKRSPQSGASHGASVLEKDINLGEEKMKLTITAMALALASAQVQAQSATSTATSAGVNAPASSIEISPSVNTGMRSFMEGNIQGGGGQATVGPYIMPSLEAGLKLDNVKASLSYSAEVSGARGIGNGYAGKRGMGDNFYSEHNPVLKASIGTGKTKFNALADLKWHIENKKTDSSFSEYFLNPDLSYDLTSAITLKAGYVMHRVNYFDTNMGAATIAEKNDVLAKGNLSTDEITKANNDIKAAQSLVGVSKVSTLHAGVVTGQFKLGEGTSLVSYARYGKKASNSGKPGSEADSYRFNADLTTSPIKNLSLALRYRFNLDDKSDKEADYYNMGRVIADVELTSSITLEMTNTFVAYQGTKAGKKATYENENYLGLVYKF